MAGSFGTPLFFVVAVWRGRHCAAAANGVAAMSGSFLAYWYYHVPNFVLAAVMYTLLGRVLLSLFLEPDSTNYIWRFFCRITDPVIALVQHVTPKAAAPVIVWLFGFVWLYWLRVLLLYLFVTLGIAPRGG